MDMSDVASRLQTRLGLGSRPDLRSALYQRLQQLVEDDSLGARAYEIIAGVVADAVGKSDPGRYFAHVVQLRLREKGLIAPPQEVF